MTTRERSDWLSHCVTVWKMMQRIESFFSSDQLFSVFNVGSCCAESELDCEKCYQSSNVKETTSQHNHCWHFDKSHPISVHTFTPNTHTEQPAAEKPYTCHDLCTRCTLDPPVPRRDEAMKGGEARRSQTDLTYLTADVLVWTWASTSDRLCLFSLGCRRRGRRRAAPSRCFWLALPLSEPLSLSYLPPMLPPLFPPPLSLLLPFLLLCPHLSFHLLLKLWASKGS